MMNFLFEQFHQATKYVKDKNPRDAFKDKHLPAAWKSITVKTYHRFNCILLPQAKAIEVSLTDIVKKRKSNRDHVKHEMNLHLISDIFSVSCAEMDGEALEGRGRRVVSSAGARYPLEVYMVTLSSVEGVEDGVYHYRPDIHAIEHIYAVSISNSQKESLFMDSVGEHFQVAFFITGVFSRSTIKYGEKAYRYTLIEAGALGQAIQNASVGLGIDSLIFGGVYEGEVEKMLGIDGFSEALVSTVLIK